MRWMISPSLITLFRLLIWWRPKAKTWLAKLLVHWDNLEMVPTSHSPYGELLSDQNTVTPMQSAMSAFRICIIHSIDYQVIKVFESFWMGHHCSWSKFWLACGQHAGRLNGQRNNELLSEKCIHRSAEHFACHHHKIRTLSYLALID